MHYRRAYGVAPVLNRQPSTTDSTLTTEDGEDKDSQNKKILIGGIIVAALGVGALLFASTRKKRGYRRNSSRRGYVVETESGWSNHKTKRAAKKAAKQARERGESASVRKAAYLT